MKLRFSHLFYSFSVLAVILFGTLATTQATNPSLKEKQRLLMLEKNYKQSKSLYVSNPKNENFRKAYILDTLTLGNAIMTSTTLAPKAKYPHALRLFREVLVIDPKNRSAMKNKELIEGIYKSMGRPIPKS